MLTRCYIGLGSNLNSPKHQINTALQQLSKTSKTTLIFHSSLYSSRPLGPQDQPDFINAVAAINTELNPHALLDKLQTIEQMSGRERKQHWGPRTLDLDLLLFGDQTIKSERLTVPHPHMRQRNFVLHPLFEIAPELTLPDGTSLKAVYEQTPSTGLERLS